MRIKDHAEQQDHRDDQLLAERPGEQPRPRRDEAGPRPLRVSHGRRDRARSVRGVGIGEKEKLPTRLLRELMARPVLAHPPSRQRVPQSNRAASPDSLTPSPRTISPVPSVE